MTSEEAKEILSAYREDLPLDEAPEVSKALALLDSDDELRRWFKDEQQFDHDLSAALGGIEVPEDLVGTILAGAPSAGVPSTEDESSKIVAFPTRRLWMAAAAAVVLTAAGLVKYFVFPPPVEFPGSQFTSVEEFREDMARYANSRFVLGHMTKDFAEARDWLKGKESPSFDETPQAIVSYEGMGCQSFSWGKNKVSLVCFKNGEDIVHLFVANKEAFEDLLPADELQSMQVRKKLQTGGWMTEDKVFLLVGSEPDVEIGAVLEKITKV